MHTSAAFVVNSVTYRVHGMSCVAEHSRRVPMSCRSVTSAGGMDGRMGPAESPAGGRVRHTLVVIDKLPHPSFSWPGSF